jgi:hypothetical protein
LGSDKWRMRQGAVLSLRQIGGAAVPALIEILRQQQGARDEEGRYLAALETLGQIGASAKEAVPLLIEVLSQQQGVRDDERRYVATLETLCQIGAPAKDVVPLLSEAVETKSALVAVAAMRALADIGKEAQAATPLLIEQLNYYRGERKAYREELKAKKKQANKEKKASRVCRSHLRKPPRQQARDRSLPQRRLFPPGPRLDKRVRRPHRLKQSTQQVWSRLVDHRSRLLKCPFLHQAHL